MNFLFLIFSISKWDNKLVQIIIKLLIAINHLIKFNEILDLTIE